MISDKINYGINPDQEGSDASDGVINSLRFIPVKSTSFISILQ